MSGGRKTWARTGSENIQARRDTIAEHAYLHQNGTPITCPDAGGKICYPSGDQAETAARALETMGGGLMSSYTCPSTVTTGVHAHLRTRQKR